MTLPKGENESIQNESIHEAVESIQSQKIESIQPEWWCKVCIMILLGLNLATETQLM